MPSPKLTLFIRRGFLPPELCTALIALIDAGRRPSTVSDYNGDAAFRTSETCDLDAAEPAVVAVETAIAAFAGLDPVYGEPIQGQRYAVGQEFMLHTDYFEPHGADFMKYCSVAGQRSWTVMIFLNEPEDGGATRFKRIDKVIKPETGKLVAWNNMDLNGQPNPWTLHAGLPVKAGTKYVVTKWFRQRPWG